MTLLIIMMITCIKISGDDYECDYDDYGDAGSSSGGDEDNEMEENFDGSGEDDGDDDNNDDDDDCSIDALVRRSMPFRFPMPAKWR